MIINQFNAADITLNDTTYVCCTGWRSPCEHGGTCVNTPGSYRCNCVTGFTGPRCEININECISNPCVNDGTCLDHKGMFACICMDGKYF